jgi:Tfp pilus assembly protein PilF
LKRFSRIDDIVEMLKNEPSDLFLNYALGIEYVSKFNFVNAEIQFKKTLEIDKNHIPSYYQLGKLFEMQQKNQEALDYFYSGLKKAKEQKNNKAINEFGEAIFLLE